MQPLAGDRGRQACRKQRLLKGSGKAEAGAATEAAKDNRGHLQAAAGMTAALANCHGALRGSVSVSVSVSSKT